MNQLTYWLVIAQSNLGGGAPAGPSAAPGVAPTGATPPPAGSGMESFILIIVMLVFFYFLLIRPQQKRQKKHQELIGNLKMGDEIITSAGVFGKITEIKGNTVMVEVAKGTKIKVLKSYVAGIANSDTEKELAETPRN